jgi:hypothetical protein
VKVSETTKPKRKPASFFESAKSISREHVLDEYDHQLAAFIQAALTGLLANRGYSDAESYILAAACYKEVDFLTQQAAVIGLQQFIKWTWAVEIRKRKKGIDDDTIVQEFNQKMME